MDDIEEKLSCSSQTASQRRKCMKRVSIFDYRTLIELAETKNIPQRHIFALWRSIVRHGTLDSNALSKLPKVLRQFVQEHCDPCTASLVERLDSNDKSTTKLVIEFFDQHKVESVIMRYGHVPLDTFPDSKTNSATHSTQHSSQNSRAFRCSPRASLCVSSQVGCSMKCRFCATGTMGLLASLTSGEIIEQLFLANRIEPIKNVVFMGMGEPLDNYQEVIDAIRMMTDVRVFSLAHHHISLSTVGVLPRLKQLKRDVPHISLALSLHAPTQEIRCKIVPTAKNWSLESILEASLDFVRDQRRSSRRANNHRRLMIEYVLIQNINVAPHVAHLLGSLLHPSNTLVHLNVIAYNPNNLDTSHTLRPPSLEEIDQFVSVVRSYQIKTTIRQTMGQDIFGACGQLVVKDKTPMETSSLSEPSDNKIASTVTSVVSPKTCLPQGLFFCKVTRFLMRAFSTLRRLQWGIYTCSATFFILFCFLRHHVTSRHLLTTLQKST